MFAAVLRIDLRLPRCTSLKDKRAVVKRVVERARRDFGVAGAETRFHDLRQRTEIGFAALAGDAAHVESVLDTVERHVWSQPDVEVLSARRSWIELDD